MGSNYYLASQNQSGYEREALSLLALASIRGVGYWTLKKIRQRERTFHQILGIDSAPELVKVLRSGNGKITDADFHDWPNIREAKWAHANRQFRELKAHGIVLLLKGYSPFPLPLANINDPAEWLFVQGDATIFKSHCISIVGTRRPTPDGLFLAQYAATLAAQLKLTIVSGLADGIDTIAHEVAIRHGVPTVAFLGTGILTPLSHSSEQLKWNIIERGGVVASEYLPDQSYSAQNFVRRNRLQAALSDSTVPVEWRIDGGTAHTVEFALKYGRRLIGLRMMDWKHDRPELQLIRSSGNPVFTVPGDETQLANAMDSIKASGPGYQMSLLEGI